MKPQDPKIFLLNLLDDNQEKINYIEETKRSQELFDIYQELQNSEDIDHKTDHSKIHDHSVKEKILKHNCLSNYHKYQIATTEINNNLKEKSFKDYFKSQWIFNPLFLLRVLKYKKNLIETPSRVKIFLAAWQGLFFSLIASLAFTNLWFLPFVFLAASSISWYVILQAPRKVINELLEMTGLGLLLVALIPLIIPVAFCFGFGVFLLIGVEQVSGKTYARKSYSADDDDYHPMDRNRWGYRDY